MTEGWIKLHRKFIEWEWFSQDEMVKLFIFLLLSANHNDGEWRGQLIKRGQLITGLKSLHEKTKISIQTLRTCLSRLEKTQEINIQSTNKFSIITILKYDSYQSDQQTTNNQTNKQSTNNQQTTNKQLTTNNKNNNIENENKKKKFIAPSLSDVENYFSECGYNSALAKKAFDYYSVANWHDSKGNPVKNWKQKMQANWFKDEGKTKSAEPVSTKKEFTVKWMDNGGLTRTYLCDTFEQAQVIYSNNFGVPPHEVIPGIK